VDRLEQSELQMMLRALADAPRLRIVEHLARQGEVSVTHLAQTFLLSQPLVSWHLRMLRRAGMVRTRRLGRQVYCSLDFERFRLCLRALMQLVTPGEATVRAFLGAEGAQALIAHAKAYLEGGASGPTEPAMGHP